MNEDISIINAETRKDKFINFLLNNKKKLIILLIGLILIPIIFFSYEIYKAGQKEMLAEKYNSVVINYKEGNENNIKKIMKEIINDKDKTYSPLALYFLIDNDFKISNEEINKFFDILIENTKLEKEIRNLIIYKKALYNSNFDNESNLIKTLNPIINSDSVWKSQALYLLGEFFYSKNEKQKSKEFFEKILLLENISTKIKLEVKKRIQRDFSD